MLTVCCPAQHAVQRRRGVSLGGMWQESANSVPLKSKSDDTAGPRAATARVAAVLTRLCVLTWRERERESDLTDANSEMRRSSILLPS